MPKQASRKLPLLFSGDAKGGTTTMGEGDSDEHLADGMVKPAGQDPGIMTDTNSIKEGNEATATASAAPKNEVQALGPVTGTSEAPPTNRHQVEAPPPIERATTNVVTVGVGDGNNGLGVKNKNNTGDHASAAEGGCDSGGGDNDGGEYDDDNDNNDDNDDDNDDDDLSSSFEEGKDSDGWGDVEAGERTGYSAAEVEPFAVKEDIYGSCIMEVCETERRLGCRRFM